MGENPDWDKLNNQFMPREILNKNFNHIEKTLNKIESDVDRLPSRMMSEFTDRYGKEMDRFEDDLHMLEIKVEKLEKVYWKFIGGVSVIIAVAAIAEWATKLFAH